MIETTRFDTNFISLLKQAINYTSCNLHEPVKIRASTESLAKAKPRTVTEFFREFCEKYKNYPALTYEISSEKQENDQEKTQNPDSKWCTITYAEYEKNVEQAALLLLHLGVQPRSSVSILAFNCPEWFYLQLGALRIGAVVTGIYLTNSVEAVHHVLDTSEATVCLVDDAHQMSKVRACKSRLKQLRAIVQLNGPFEDFVGKEEGYYCWSDLFEMKFGLKLHEELRLRERDVAANECALLIFTSGTVGMPKGVMISHDNILSCSHGLVKSLPNIKPGAESMVSYMPLNHIGAQFFDIYVAIECGALVHFADRNALKDTLLRTMLKAKPTIFFGVPRIYEKLQAKIQDNWLASKMVDKVKSALGLERSKILLTGGAPISLEMRQLFLSLDLPLVDIYGLSEVSGAVVFNFQPHNTKTVGKAIGEVETKINNPNEKGEGEILFRSRTNFMGYLKEPLKTQETITSDGWLKTGDCGYMDQEGNLYISGRLKELIITAGGENIPPAYIEDLIKKELPCISNAVVIGDRRKYLTVLLTLKTDIDPDTGYPLDTLSSDTIAWLRSLDLNYTYLSEILHINLPENLKDFDASNVEVKLEDKVFQSLEAGIKRANQHAISNAQKVQYFTVLPHDFSIPTNELGPTLKIRRNIIHQKYAKIIDKMYKE